MKSLSMLVVAVALLVGVSGLAVAQDQTLSGSILCAKCTLKKADATSCQDVLVVKDANGATKEYYVTKNAVLEKFGHTCRGEKGAEVVGTVAEKDGKTWITPAKMMAKK